jgi:hypothetical protein
MRLIQHLARAVFLFPCVADAPAFGQCVEDDETRVVARAGVLAAWVAQADDEP